MATGAKGVSRAEAPKLYNVLENLCISRGLPMPALQIIETPALNAYASGLREGQYTVAVTRGLVDTLADDELEAVLAHELTHIRNRDTQLMVIAVIFAGIFAFFGDLRDPRLGLSLRLVADAAPARPMGLLGLRHVERMGWRFRPAGDSSSDGRSSGAGAAGAILAIVLRGRHRPRSPGACRS